MVKQNHLHPWTQTFTNKSLEENFTRKQFIRRLTFIRLAIALTLAIEMLQLPSDFHIESGPNLFIRSSIIILGWLTIIASYRLRQIHVKHAIIGYIYLYMAIKLVRIYWYHHSPISGAADIIGSALFIYLLFPINWLPKVALASLHSCIAGYIYYPYLQTTPETFDYISWIIIANALGSYFALQTERNDRKYYANAISLKQALEEANRLRHHSLLTSDLITHEIRAPILSAQQLLVNLGNDQQKEHIEQLHNQCLSFIDEWTDEARERPNELKVINDSATYLQELLRSILQSLPEQQAKSIRVTPSKQLPTVIINERILHLALKNVIDNAYQHGNGHQGITIQFRQYARFVGIRVRDFGPGMNDEQAEQVFVVKSKSARSESDSGLGLGMSIVRKLLSYDGSDIIIQSHPGKGTAFIIMMAIHRQR